MRKLLILLLFGALLLFSADCALTTYDLRYSNPKIPIYQICDKPLDVSDDVDLWGYNFTTKRLVTAEDPLELRMFYGADAFFEYDPDAPLSSLEHAAPEWGLTCVQPVTFLAGEDEFLPWKPCIYEIADVVGRDDPRWLSQTEGRKGLCDPPLHAKRVHVCVHPPGVPADVKEWGMVRGVKGNRLTRDEKDYAKRAAKAEIIFVYDKDAPPESVYYFVQGGA